MTLCQRNTFVLMGGTISKERRVTRVQSWNLLVQDMKVRWARVSTRFPSKGSFAKKSKKAKKTQAGDWSNLFDLPEQNDRKTAAVSRSRSSMESASNTLYSMAPGTGVSTTPVGASPIKAESPGTPVCKLSNLK